MDVYESSFGTGGEDRHEGHPEDPEEIRQSEEPIMARLPKSRPKRATPRKAARARAAGGSKAAPSGGAARRPARPRTSSPASRTRSRTAASKTRAPGARTSGSGDRTVFGPSEHAPGLPRLALDGAIEAAKLPIKVGANITFRALDAVTKALQRR